MEDVKKLEDYKYKFDNYIESGHKFGKQVGYEEIILSKDDRIFRMLVNSDNIVVSSPDELSFIGDKIHLNKNDVVTFEYMNEEFDIER